MSGGWFDVDSYEKRWWLLL